MPSLFAAQAAKVTIIYGVTLVGRSCHEAISATLIPRVGVSWINSAMANLLVSVVSRQLRHFQWPFATVSQHQQIAHAQQHARLAVVEAGSHGEIGRAACREK